MFENVSILYTQLYTPTLPEIAHTDIHTPRPKLPGRPEIRHALPTRLYAPIRPFYTQRAHTGIYTPHPKRPEIRHTLSTRSYVPPLAHYILRVLTHTYIPHVPNVPSVPRLDTPYPPVYMRSNRVSVCSLVI